MVQFLTTNKFRKNEVGVLAKDEMTDDHPDNQKLEKRASGDESPVDGSRRCTDILFLVLLVCSWATMSGIGLAATGVIDSKHIKQGDPRRLVNGMDFYGNLCGATNYVTALGTDTANLPKAYPMPSGFSVCVESCPSETNYDEYICEYDVQHELDSLFDSSQLVGDVLSDTSEAKKSLYVYYATRKQCMPKIESRSFLGYCIPKLSINEVVLESNHTQQDSNDTNSTQTSVTDVSIPIASKATSKGSDFFDVTMADVTKVQYPIFIWGCGASLALGVLFLVVIQLPGVLSILVWTMVFAIGAGLAVSGNYTKQTSIRWAASGMRTTNETAALFYASYVLYALTGIWILIVLFLRKRIVLAIACVREAAKAIASMPVITLFPVVQVFGLVAFTIVWGIYMAFLASSGEITAQCMCPITDENTTLATSVETVDTNDDGICPSDCFMQKDLSYSTNTKYAGLYLLFVWFWTSQFIVAAGQLIVARATALWYFSRSRSIVSNSTFIRAIGLVCFYHLGTAAFGSLIIAVVKTIRAVLTYVQAKAKKSKLKVAVVVLSMLKCLLWCLEKILKFINKQAYIQTAIFGYSFCKASRKGFFLIMRNALRISAVSIVSQIVLFIGKVFITVSSAVGGYYYLEIHFGEQLNSLMVPTALIAIVAYAVSEMFSEVFGMAISTILQCFVVDEELFDPDDRFAPSSLASTIDLTQQKYKKKKKVGVKT